MSLAIKYERLEDARLRLKHTVVLYKGEPHYISEITNAIDKEDGIHRVLSSPLPLEPRDPFAELKKEDKEGQQRKIISSKFFDIAPFKMGFVNAPDGVFYCSRLPNRMQKQGLSSENFKGATLTGKPVQFSTFLRTKEVLEMIKGLYPSFHQALKALDKAPSCAFSREFAIVKDKIAPPSLLCHLWHKDAKVGLLMNNSVHLGSRFSCLKESLTELGIKVEIM